MKGSDFKGEADACGDWSWRRRWLDSPARWRPRSRPGFSSSVWVHVLSPPGAPPNLAPGKDNSVNHLAMCRSYRPSHPVTHHFLHRKGERPFIGRWRFPSIGSQAAQSGHASTCHLPYSHAPWPHSLHAHRGAVQRTDGVYVAHRCASVGKKKSTNAIKISYFITTHTIIKHEKIYSSSTAFQSKV